MTDWYRLRGMLRFAILCGDVIEEGQDWEGVRSGYGEGLDRNRRLEYWDVLKALRLLRSNDPFAHELLRRHVGYHCESTRCERMKLGAVHWHSIGVTDLVNRGHSRESLAERREKAMEYVVDLTRVAARV